MASPGYGQRNLDATDREVVYCYNCSNEWYRDEHALQDLICPRCHNDFVQIVGSSTYRSAITMLTSSQVEPDNDPRPGVQQRGPRSDSDPDEDDIDEYLTSRDGPGSFILRRSVYHSSDSPFETHFGRSGPNSSADRPRARPDDPGVDVLSRFADMFAELGGVRVPGSGQQGASVFGTQPRIQRTTFTRSDGSGGGVASFTFTTTTGGAAGDRPEVPAFDTYVRSRHGNPGIRRHTIIVVTNGRANSNGNGSLFRGLLGNLPPPGAEDSGGGPGQGGGQRGPPGFATGLQEFLLSLLNPQAAVHGDAVYTQEALDRIITTLMENNPQSNAAPPATQAAIEKLPKKILDDQMIGPEGKAECTICIDEMHKGDEATVLPCKHWFHGECVTLWLKEHNTCPICRMPIEGGNPSGNNNHSHNSQPSESRQEASANASSASAFASASTAGRNPFESLNPFGSQSQSAADRVRRTEQEREERLERIRNLAGIRRSDSQGQSEGITQRTSHSPPRGGDSSFNMRPRVRDPSPPRDRGTSTAWQPSTGNSNSQSNNSNRYSSTLARNLWGRSNSNSGEGSLQREGGGSQQQQNQQQQQSSSSGNGALGWLRDHFGRGSGSGSGSERRR